ncbi:MAG: YbaB/EbfC family nucleoid-associated protein [Vampirovibrionales bacterium]|nr:YbaB/EbfC family nucleoid-associated protein [Vampirovibrionales bacterium]
MFDIQKMMKQAQKMQDQMQEVQKEMESRQFTGTAGGGAVTVVCNGKFEFLSVKISPEAAQDAETLEDLMMAALKDATSTVSRTLEDEMKKVTAGMNIPGLKLPF